MSEERLELSTNGLKGHCSAIELLALAIGILTRPTAAVNAKSSPITSPVLPKISYWKLSSLFQHFLPIKLAIFLTFTPHL
jgi:hypothetical protein